MYMNMSQSRGCCSHGGYNARARHPCLGQLPFSLRLGAISSAACDGG